MRWLVVAFLLFVAAPAAAQTAPCSVVVDSPTAIAAAIATRNSATYDGQRICIKKGIYDFASRLVPPERPGWKQEVIVETEGGCPDRIPTELDRPNLAALRSSASWVRIIETATRAGGWRFQCLSFDVVPGVRGATLMWLGDPFETNVANRAVGLSMDRILCAPAEPTHRCIYVALTENFSLTRSKIGQFLIPVTDTQGVALVGAYCGPCIIADNDFGTSTEPIMIGGGDPAVPNLNPRDVRVLRNTVTWDLSLKGSGKGVFKHGIEFKQGIGVLIDRNTVRNTWSGEGHGYAPGILVGVRDQSGGCPLCELSQVTITNNRLLNVASGIGYHGIDDLYPSAQSVGFTITNNIVEVTEGYALMGILSPFQNLIERNTFACKPGSAPWCFNSMLVLDPVTNPKKIDSLIYRDNYTAVGYYGVKGPAGTLGTAALAAATDSYLFTGNVIGGLEQSQAPQTPAYFPPGQSFLTLPQFHAAFVPGSLCFTTYAGKGADCAAMGPEPPPPPVGGEGTPDPPPVNVCVSDPLKLTVNKNNGWPVSALGTQLRYAVNKPAVVSFDPLVMPWRATAVDARGCKVTVFR